jgi:hypothetical protein
VIETIAMNLLRRLEALEKEEELTGVDHFTYAGRAQRDAPWPQRLRADAGAGAYCTGHQLYGTRQRTHDRSGAGLIEQAPRLAP